MGPSPDLLQQQIEQFLGSRPVPDELQDLFCAIERSYQEFRTQSELFERALEENSLQLLEASAETRAMLLALPDMFLHINADDRIINAQAGRPSAGGVALSTLETASVMIKPWRAFANTRTKAGISLHSASGA